MIRDAGTVAWKELREGIDRRGGGGRFGGAGVLLVTVAVFGLVIPLSIGESYVGVPMIGLTVAAAVLMVMSIVPDSFAGERDRGTLETLLASRLPDRAILLGKVAARRCSPGASGSSCWSCRWSPSRSATAPARPRRSRWSPPWRRAPPGLGDGRTRGAAVAAGVVGAVGPAWRGRLRPVGSRRVGGGRCDGDEVPVLAGAAILVALDLVLLAAADLRFRRARLVRPGREGRASRRGAAAPGPR